MEAVERRGHMLSVAAAQMRGIWALCSPNRDYRWLQNGSQFSGTFASSVIPNCCSSAGIIFPTGSSLPHLCCSCDYAYTLHTRIWHTHTHALACTNTHTPSHPLVQYSPIHFKHIGLGKVCECVSIIEKEMDGILAVCYSTVLQGCKPVHVLTWEISDCS